VNQLDRIEEKIDRLLFLLGDGKGKLPSEIRREAQAKILQLSARKRKRGHVSEKKGAE